MELIQRQTLHTRSDELMPDPSLIDAFIHVVVFCFYVLLHRIGSQALRVFHV